MESPSYEELAKIFNHNDDIEDIIEAFEEGTVEYLRHDLVKKLIEHELYEE